jgi:predicted nuclease of predicted toxin-antitoxin system
VKLLFDQNLPMRLVEALREQFPGSSHVRMLGLDTAPDRSIWEFAKAQGFTVVSKDNDFRDLVHRLGAPPKAVIVDIGNSTTADILALLHEHARSIAEFGQSDSELLVIADT